VAKPAGRNRGIAERWRDYSKQVSTGSELSISENQEVTFHADAMAP